MRFSTATVQRDRAAGTTFKKALLWICTLVLALQLIGSALHDHGVEEQLSDCFSCQMAGHFPADVPAAGIQLLAVFLLVAYVLARLPRCADVVVLRYLIPVPQAPPSLHFPVQ